MIVSEPIQILRCPGSADTFLEGTAARQILNDEIKRVGGRSLDLFARNCMVCDIRNDIDPETAAEWHLDAAAAVERFAAEADLLVVDPPYSETQQRRKYRGSGSESLLALSYRLRRAIGLYARPGTRVLWASWSSFGMHGHPGWQRSRSVTIQHGAVRPNTWIVIDELDAQLCT